MGSLIWGRSIHRRGSWTSWRSNDFPKARSVTLVSNLPSSLWLLFPARLIADNQCKKVAEFPIEPQSLGYTMYLFLHWFFFFLLVWFLLYFQKFCSFSAPKWSFTQPDYPLNNFRYWYKACPSTNVALDLAQGIVTSLVSQFSGTFCVVKAGATCIPE